VNIVVLVKYVPNPQGTPQLGPDNLLVRSGVEGALDPGDEYAVEAALQIAEAAGDSEVTAVSMGPEEAGSAINRALAMGASRGILVTDDALRGADVLVTARVLAAAIGHAPFDLVIAGVESTDGYTGTLPATVAELLGVPSVTFARKLDVENGAVRAERQTETGYDVVTCTLPVVVTVTTAVADPRYPSLKGIMGAKQKPVDRLNASDLGLEGGDLVASQSVIEVTDAPAKASGEVIEAGPDTAARIADFLAEAKVI
jgi:electron transfer flavoprotein beta subunit